MFFSIDVSLILLRCIFFEDNECAISYLGATSIARSNVSIAVAEQEGYDRDQILWKTTSSGWKDNGSCHDSQGCRANLGWTYETTRYSNAVVWSIYIFELNWGLKLNIFISQLNLASLHFTSFWSDGFAIASGGPLNSRPSLSLSVFLPLPFPENRVIEFSNFLHVT